MQRKKELANKNSSLYWKLFRVTISLRDLERF